MATDFYPFCVILCVICWVTAPLLTLMLIVSGLSVSAILLLMFVMLAGLLFFTVKMADWKKQRSAVSGLSMYYTIANVPDDPSDPNSPCSEQIVLMSAEDILKE